MKNRTRRPYSSWASVVLLVAGIGGTSVIGVITSVRLASGPAWELSVRPTDQGVAVSVFREGESQPDYETLLAGAAVPIEVSRISRERLPAEVGRTIFHDTTVRPGRWTIEIDGRRLDILPRGLIIDERETILPVTRR